jgi:trans-aconitate methyltransferase
MQQHWENIYKTKQPHEVSWTQNVPAISLEFIHNFSPAKNSSIIDVGGGDSRLVDHLLNEGFTNVTVLDISEEAIKRAQNRLGDKKKLVTWIVSDVLEFKPDQSYDIWHDRAAFHFQTEEVSINNYIDLVNKAVAKYVIVGTFSTNGPTKCSGINIKQYDSSAMKARFENNNFKNTTCKYEDHITPSGSVQNFTFCGFKRV